MNQPAFHNPIIIGLSMTGLSVARYFIRCGQRFSVMDLSSKPQGLEQLRALAPDVPVYLGELNPSVLLAADVLIVSPGVPLDLPAIAAAKQAGVEVIGDIELFVRHARSPIIAITGTNGKSTVTSLTGQVLEALAKQVIVAGNIGTPVLDCLQEPPPDYYVLELSSFQLATTQSLKAEVAVCLNISPDHLDRHLNFAQYQQCKHTIYNHCQRAVINEDDRLSWQGASLPQQVISFGLKERVKLKNSPAQSKRCFMQPMEQGGGEHVSAADLMLIYNDEPFCRLDELSPALADLPQNALAVMSIVLALGLDLQPARAVFFQYAGLEHRCQLVCAPDSDLMWYNDSKATNVGAAIASLKAVAARAQQKLIWIAGGQSKGVDVSCMKPVIEDTVAAVVLMGQDAQLLQDQLQLVMPSVIVQNMEQAVARAAELARHLQVGTVLLAPACASLDQFKNYKDRGEQFIRWIKKNVSQKNAGSSE